MNDSPRFYLLPAPIKPNGWEFLPAYALQIYHNIDYFLAENTRTARRFLKEIHHPLPQMEVTVHRYDKKTPLNLLDELMHPLLLNKSIAYVSESGSAAIADPGSKLVLWAHRHNITVRVIPGPISLMLALAGSGLNGQNFHFHGYLPIKEPALRKKVEKLQGISVKNATTHIFIETPYRSEKTFKILLKTLHKNISLCLAMNLTMDSEIIKTTSVENWRKDPPHIVKGDHCVFLFSAAMD